MRNPQIFQSLEGKKKKKKSRIPVSVRSLAPHHSPRFSSPRSLFPESSAGVRRQSCGPLWRVLFFFSPPRFCHGWSLSIWCQSDQLPACERRAGFKANRSISASKASKEMKGENSTVGVASPRPPSAAAASAGLAVPALPSASLAD